MVERRQVRRMTEMVACTECHAQYDSEETPFCPRCGGQKHVDATTHREAWASMHKRRRRGAAWGSVIVLGMSLVLALMLAGAAPTLFGSGLHDIESAYAGMSRPFDVQLLDGQAVVANHTVFVERLDGTPSWNGTTDAEGLLTVPPLEGGSFRLQVLMGNGTTEALVRAWDTGIDVEATVVFHLDTQTAVVPDILLPRDMSVAMGVLYGVLGLTAVAGIWAAIRGMRSKVDAQTLGLASLGGLPWFLFGMAAILLGLWPMFLLLLVYVAGVISMWRTRPRMPSRAA